MLKIWGRKNSINVQKVLWCCAELGLTYERVDAGMAFGVNDTPEYRALNPNRLVPTIDDDSYVLWESNTIVRYLAARYGEGGLYPADLKTRFDAERWMDWQLTTLHNPMRDLFWGLVRTPPEKRDPDVLRKAQAEAATSFAILDDHLSRRPYIAGDAFTVGDIPLGAFAYRWLALDIERPDKPHLRRWYERLTERPGFREHIMLPLT